MKTFRLMLPLIACFLANSTPASAQCSIVKLNGLSKIAPGTPVRITAEVPAAIPAAKLSFKWKLSAGTITKGDNSPSILIDTTNLGGQTITVTVQVLGTTSSCRNTAEKTIDVDLPRPPDEKFDSYGDIKFEDEKARLDNFAIRLSLDNSYFAHIIAYAGRRTYPNEANERLARAKDYLVKVRGASPNRIITVDCGHTEDFYVFLWLWPGGTPPIRCEWDQIPRDQVDFSKPRPRQSNGRH